MNEPMQAKPSCCAQPKSDRKVQQARLSAAPIRPQKNTAWCINIWRRNGERLVTAQWRKFPLISAHCHPNTAILSLMLCAGGEKEGWDGVSSRHPLPHCLWCYAIPMPKWQARACTQNTHTLLQVNQPGTALGVVRYGQPCHPRAHNKAEDQTAHSSEGAARTQNTQQIGLAQISLQSCSNITFNITYGRV